MAMRGHASIQGSTDIADALRPAARLSAAAGRRRVITTRSTLTSSTRACRPATGRTSASSSSACSRRGTATPRRRRTTSASTGCRGSTATTRSLPYFDRMAQGEVKGYFLFGQNPAGGGPNAGLASRGPARARLAGRAATGSRPRAPSSGRATRAARRRRRSRRRCSSSRPRPLRRRRARLTNTQRLLQWHDKAVDPPGDCRSDAWFVYNLGKRLKNLYAGSDDRRIRRCSISPGTTTSTSRRAAGRHAEPDRRGAGYGEGAAGDQWLRIGRDRSDKKLLGGFSDLKDDGTTACGCWIYSGVFPETRRNRAREAQARRQSAAAGLGLRLAAQPPHDVQPRVRRPRGPAVVGAEEVHLVGRRAEASGSGPTSRTSSPTKPPDYRPPPRATGMAAIERRCSRSS